MASVWRVTATWQNFIGAPGYSRFSFIGVTGDAGAIAATAAVRTFLNAFATNVPAGVTIQVHPEVQEYDEANGQLVGEIVASTTPAVVSCTGAGSWAGGSGIFVGWKTGTIWQGRRVQGRTFIVPVVLGFESNGTPTAALISSATSAGNALIADANSTFAVWAKQFSKPTDPTQKPQQIGGAAFQVLTTVVKDQPSQLRSRR